MGRMLAVGLGPLALGLLFLALLGGVQGEVSSIPESLNVTADQLMNSQQMRNYCDRKIESLDCKNTSKLANEQTCLETSVGFLLLKEANRTVEMAEAVLSSLRGLHSVTRIEICAFMDKKATGQDKTTPPTTTPASPSATNGSGSPEPVDSAPKITPMEESTSNGTANSSSTTSTASPGTNSTTGPVAEAEDSGIDPLYWVIPLVVVLLVIMGLIGIVIRRYTKRVGFQSSGKTCGGEPIKNDGSDV